MRMALLWRRNTGSGLKRIFWCSPLLRRVRYCLPVLPTANRKSKLNDTIDAVYSRLVPNGELLQANEDELKQFMDAADQLFHVRRINPVRSLIDSVLYEGARSRRKEGVFGNARVISENEKQISAVIVGLGQYGSEMLKARWRFFIAAPANRRKRRSCIRRPLPSVVGWRRR